MLLCVLLYLLIARVANGKPAPQSNATPNSDDDVTVRTGYRFRGCDKREIKILNQEIKDSIVLAKAGLDYISDELIDSYPQYAHRQIDFSKRAAIDFFGPESQNKPYQYFIFDAMYKAANAYPGWGLSDWWNDRYIQISCIDEGNECSDTIPAYNMRRKRDYGYPLIVYCPVFFSSKLPSHKEAVAKIDNNKALQQNLANMRSRAANVMHELLHINWGTAQVCSGKGACIDHRESVKNGSVLAYKTGRSKLLANRNIKEASRNTDNLVYYAMARFMEKRWKKYPKYPSRWDPAKTAKENQERERNEPGFPPDIQLLFEGGSLLDSQTPVDDPVYPASYYPDWYQPLIEVDFEDPTPDVTQPSQSKSKFNGPNMKTNVRCDTTKNAPNLEYCGYVIGSLKKKPRANVPIKEKGETWTAGWASTCAIEVRFKEDWTKDCKVTMKDIDDHATAILTKCQNPKNWRVGGQSQLKGKGCSAVVEVKAHAVSLGG